MNVQDATITIPQCPLCETRHTYKLKITRTLVMQIDGEDEPGRDVPLTRVFTCPVKNQDFEATFVIHETPTSHVTSVEVTT